ncbi:MFS transporter [Friedmanniella luteola]|uniref:MFS transporter n=1 Tax=Friedmanniella luteola TaxID=546871 RepID=UPI000B837FE2|nr:MFS transporter [Friedmanniella luteola]
MPDVSPSPPARPTSAELGTGLSAYLRLLRHRPARDPFLAAFVARLPMAMAPLGMLLLVEAERGTYSLAGFVTGAYAIGSALGTPLWGRLMDRFGQVRVLVPTALVSASFMTALALATTSTAPPVLLVALAALAGFGYPPMSPALRSSWRVIFPDRESRQVAFALDATSVELLFVGGPLLVSLLLAVSPPVVPLLATAGAMAGGTLAYCATGAARRSRPAGAPPTALDDDGVPVPNHRSALAAAGVVALLLVMLAMSIGFGQLDTSLAATAGIVLGSRDSVGLLFLAIAGGSAVGGLVYGTRSWPFDERRAVPTLLALFALMLAVMAVLLGLPEVPLWLLFPVLVVTGATVAPTLIMQQSLLDHLAPAHRLNEAQAFLSAANTTGAAVGIAIAGVLIDFRGLGFSFGGRRWAPPWPPASPWPARHGGGGRQRPRPGPTPPPVAAEAGPPGRGGGGRRP